MAGVVATVPPGRRFALAGACLLLAAACTAAGLWQVERFGAKRRANAELRHNAAAAAVPADTLLAAGRPVDPALRYRRVVVAGRYDVAGQVLVRQREVDGQPGFLVVTPLRTAGPAALVVRGFVPSSGPADQTPSVPAPPAGVVTVTGRVLPSEPPRPTAGLPAGQVERIDVPALAARLGVPTYGGYLELVDAAPLPGLAPTPPPDLGNPAGGAVEGQHLAYIVQWFFFALLALAGPVLLPALDRRAAAAEAAEAAARSRRPVTADALPAAD